MSRYSIALGKKSKRRKKKVTRAKRDDPVATFLNSMYTMRGITGIEGPQRK